MAHYLHIFFLSLILQKSLILSHPVAAKEQQQNKNVNSRQTRQTLTCPSASYRVERRTDKCRQKVKS